MILQLFYRHCVIELIGKRKIFMTWPQWIQTQTSNSFFVQFNLLLARFRKVGLTKGCLNSYKLDLAVLTTNA